MSEPRSGWQGALYYKRGGVGAAGDWVLHDNVRDVTLNDADDEGDVTTRGNGGFKAAVATLTDISIDVEMVHDPDDAGYDAFRNAKINRSKLGIRVLDKPLAEGGEGIEADMAVLSFNRGEPIGDVMMVTATLKPTYSPGYAPTYLEAGATASGT